MRLRHLPKYKGAKDAYSFQLEFRKSESPTGEPYKIGKVFHAPSLEGAWEQARAWRDSFAPAGAIGSSRNLVDALIGAIDARAKMEIIDLPTAYQYRSLVRRYVEPRFGNLDVSELRPYQVVAMYTDLMSGGAPKGRPLAGKTLRQLHSCLSSTYAFMVEVGLVEASPLGSVPRPGGTERSRPPVADEDLGALVRAIAAGLSDDSTGEANIRARNLKMAMYLEFMTGARVGEICALTRSDVNLWHRSMRVAHTLQDVPGRGLVRKCGTKGRRRGRRRDVSISDSACREIERHLRWQGLYLQAADDDTPLISYDGGFVRQGDVTRAFAALRDSLELPPDVTLHSLRHSHAVQLLAHGVTLAEAKDRLGHSRIGTTVDIYANGVIDSRARAAAEAMGAVWAEKGGDGA